MWNAEMYNYYDKERIQPSIDLVNRIRDNCFNRILDVGCGTGMSTASLLARWGNAEIIGVDLSAQMLEKAKLTLPTVLFEQRDCRESLDDMGNFDLVFSNAFLQWLPNQEAFIHNSFEMLNEKGVFAAQIPLFEEMPANECILVAESVLNDSFSHNDLDNFALHSASEYYDMLAKVTNKIIMWSTDYYHEMNDHHEILEFLKGAALRPYFDLLTEKEQEVFMAEVQKNIEKAYPLQQNGKVLFPFKRLFLIGEK